MPQEKAYFAAGCFWGVEAIFASVSGVLTTSVGYMNGLTNAPVYKEVCTGLTQHVEAVEVVFDGEIISFNQLLWLFWHLHDPTQLNRQGADVGTQYRSGIYTTTSTQTEIAQKSKAFAQTLFTKTIVSEVLPAETFWKAEDYHQQYLAKNPWRGACHVVHDIEGLLQSAPAL
ncbi:MAG: peptide-methionine (S)-S-oxide reductase MsrA [Vampirovibrionales bacterium]